MQCQQPDIKEDSVELIHPCVLLKDITLQTERLSVDVVLLSIKLAGLGFLFYKFNSEEYAKLWF